MSDTVDDVTEPGTKMIRVFLADDHEVVRQGLRALLEAEPDIEVTGEASGAQEALDRIDRLWPLAFLAAPAAWGIVLVAGEPMTSLFWLAFLAMAAGALWLIRRRRPGDVGRAVALMLAGICLFDAMLIAGTGAPGLALLAAAGFPLTLLLQRWVPGT